MVRLLNHQNGTTLVNPGNAFFRTIVVFLVVIMACGECLSQTVASSTDDSKLSREQTLDADLDEAIEMLQQKKHLILYLRFSACRADGNGSRTWRSQSSKSNA